MRVETTERPNATDSGRPANGAMTALVEAQPPMAATASRHARPLRPDGVTVLAAYHFLLSGLLLLTTLGLAIPTVITAIVGVVEDSDVLIATGILGLLAAVTMMLCLVMLALGFGLWTMRQWARVATIAMAIVGLSFVPVGTIIGGVTLWYLLKPEISSHFHVAARD